MIISKRKKFIFVAIPKTATTSIEKVLDNYNDIIVPKHTTFSELENNYGINHKEFYTFCFVRNPYDRIVSQYLQLKKNPGKKYDNSERRYYYKFCNNNSFDDFIKLLKKERRDIFFQSKFVFNEDNTLKVDFVGRFENLQNDFNIICDKIGIPRVELLKENVTQEKKHYSDYYRTKTKKNVEELFEKEIKYFGYSFEKMKK